MRGRRVARYLTAATASLVLAVAACKTPPLAEQLNAHVADPMDGNRLVQVGFVTNRSLTKNTPGCSDRYYTVERGSQVHHGVCAVSVPRGHSIGALDTTESGVDRNQHFVMTEHRALSREQYFAGLDSTQGPVLVFIHGFNVKFEEAVLRAAQIAYDAKFQGTVLLFSWPAGAGGGVFSSLRMDSTYTQNQKNAQETIPVLQDFLAEVISRGRPVFLVVHSMGHQLTLPALGALAAKGSAGTVQEVILTAPDFAVEEFQKLAPQLQKVGRRVTLYCSPADNALKASQRLNGNQRIGQCARVPGIDVINVNQVDSPVMGIGGLGHGYYSSRALLTDLFQLMLGMDAKRRLFIRAADANGNEDYVLRN